MPIMVYGAILKRPPHVIIFRRICRFSVGCISVSYLSVSGSIIREMKFNVCLLDEWNQNQLLFGTLLSHPTVLGRISG